MHLSTSLNFNVVSDRHQTTKDLVKTGMCKINEPPCQLQLEARCFICFVLQGEWNGCFYSMDWFTVMFPVFQKNLPVLQFEESHSEDVCIHTYGVV